MVLAGALLCLVAPAAFTSTAIVLQAVLAHPVLSMVAAGFTLLIIYVTLVVLVVARQSTTSCTSQASWGTWIAARDCGVVCTDGRRWVVSPTRCPPRTPTHQRAGTSDASWHNQLRWAPLVYCNMTVSAAHAKFFPLCSTLSSPMLFFQGERQLAHCRAVAASTDLGLRRGI